MNKYVLYVIIGCVVLLSFALKLRSNYLAEVYRIAFAQANVPFQKKDYAAALLAYDAIATQYSNPQVRKKAFYRTCVSLYLLNRYDEAIERMQQYEEKYSDRNLYHFLLLKEDIYIHLLYQLENKGYLPEFVVKNPADKTNQLTSKDLMAEINALYGQLWENRHKLIKLPLNEEHYFYNLRGIDFGMYPTVLDYTVKRWIEYYEYYNYYTKEGTGVFFSDAEVLLSDKFNQPVQLNDRPGLLSAQLMESLNHMHTAQHQQAKERWKINRLLLPLQRPYLYIYPVVRNYAGYASQAEEFLMRWADEFKHPEAQAEALYQTAQLYNTHLAFTQEASGIVHDLCLRIDNEFPQSKANAKSALMCQSSAEQRI